jgi:hypothetical protein
MARKTASLGPIALTMIAGLVVVLCALAVPMHRGASLWEAIAVLPQAVLWPVPIALALPVLVALATRVRPRRKHRRDPDRDILSSGSLGAFADLLRRAAEGRWARSRVVARLARLAIHTASLRHAASEEEAWALFQKETTARDPEVARFLRREGLFNLSGEAFAALVDRTLTYLEKYEQEA